MDTQFREQANFLKDLLLQDGARFKFLKALYLVEKFYAIESYNKKNKFNELIPAFKLKSNFSLAFTGSSIQHIAMSKRYKNTIEILVNFFTLTGAHGIFPDYLSEMLTDKTFQKEYSLEDFLDIFNHRLIFLLYQVFKTTRPQLHQGSPGNDHMASWLFSLMGIFPSHREKMQTFDSKALLYYTGHYAQQKKTVAGLRNILSDYFCLRVEIDDLIGDFYNLTDFETTRLGKHKESATELGKTAVLGKQVWLQNSKIQIRLFLEPHHQPLYFHPGAKLFNDLISLVKFYTESTTCIELVLVCYKIKQTFLSSFVKLGLNTWLTREECSNMKTASIKFEIPFN